MSSYENIYGHFQEVAIDIFINNEMKFEMKFYFHFH